MNIPSASWRDHPPAIEFKSSDLPLRIIRELAAISLNHVNVSMRRGEVMSIDQGTETEDGAVVFRVTPDKPETHVYGPDIVSHHNDLIQTPERHEGLLALAERRAQLTELDAGHTD